MVYVLLSTYNGARFIRELLESLLRQDYPQFTVLARDDGSTDNTCRILREYAGTFRLLSIQYGKNLGVVASFFELLKAVPDDAQFIAFCDQDDVWEKEKLSRAVEVLNTKINKPVMYCGRLKIVNEALELIRLSRLPQRPPALGNALVQNIAIGCTVVINRQALDLLRARLPNPAAIRMHDWWIYQVAAAMGEVVYDQEAYVLYRQHAENVVGSAAGMRLWALRVRRFIKKSNRLLIRLQVQEFARVFRDKLPQDKRRLLDGFLRAISAKHGLLRIKFALSADVYRQTWAEDMVLKALIILGRI